MRRLMTRCQFTSLAGRGDFHGDVKAPIPTVGVLGVMSLVCLVVFVVWFGGPLLLWLGSPDPFRVEVSDPLDEFMDVTGLSGVEEAKVLLAVDSHGGFHGDGGLYVIIAVDPGVIDNVLQGDPPWGQPAWSHGPIPRDIEVGSGIGTLLDDAKEAKADPFPSNKEQHRVLESGKTHYVGLERCCEDSDLRWHNGNVLIVDPETSTIWLSVFDS